MIITVTLNPAIDKTIELNSFEKGTLNRVKNSITNIGGKGINVSFTLKVLGVDSVATGLLGGEEEDIFLKELKKSNIKASFCNQGYGVRTNIKIMEENGTLTELNEAGPNVSEKVIQDFIEKYQELVQKDDLVILSGSVPNGVSDHIYEQLIQIAHKEGAKVILDADGPLFVNGIEAFPDVVKPNEEELLHYGKLINEEGDLFHIVRCLLNKGIPMILLSMGSKGAYVFPNHSEYYYDVSALEVPVKSTVGAGDSLTAGWATAIVKEMSILEAIRFSIAVSAATVMTTGTMPPEKENVEKLLSKVKIETRKW